MSPCVYGAEKHYCIYNDCLHNFYEIIKLNFLFEIQGKIQSKLKR